MIAGQVGAIVWAQWRSIFNSSSNKQGGRFSITFLFGAVWYGLWTFGAYGLAQVAADPENTRFLHQALPIALLVVFLYWQLVPIMMASTGISLDLSRLLVYPIPHGHLFAIEVVLRITTSVEMLLATGGLAVGLARNPDVPWWSVPALAPFVLLNLFLSVGLRDLFTRLMTKKGFREAAVFFIVLLAAAPQLMLTRTPSRAWRSLIERGFGEGWPWSSTARAVMGNPDWVAWLLLLGWTVLAFLFGRWQFERSLRSDAAESRATRRSTRRMPYVIDVALRLPLIVLRDPLAALFEKEIRTLSRAPRFRLLFMMGFSFGLLIWLPLAMRGDAESTMRSNYLTIVSAYALMLLSEICFWNVFGIDRAAAQSYFVMPVKFRTVLFAKNLAAAFFIFCEISLVAGFCTILRMPISASDVVEAFSVIALLGLFMLSAGNLLSTRYPRPVDANQSWRSGSVNRVQAFLLVVYPVASLPVLLAYGARYAFDSSIAFYAVLAIDAVLGIIVYFISLDSAVSTAHEQKEQFLTALSRSQGPLAG